MTRQNQVATIYEKIVRTDKKKLIKITAITLAAVALGICVVFAVYGIIYNVRRNAAPPVDISSYTGDVNYGSGDENRIAKQVGKVDLMKVGHHGLGYSTGSPLLTATQPPVAIVTNLEKNIYFGTKFRLVMNSRSAIYSTGEYNGIAAVIGDDKGDIALLSNIH